MPVNGLVFEAEEMEWKVASSAIVSHTGDGDGIGTHTATGGTLFAPDAEDLLPGMILEAGATLDSAGVWTRRCFYDGPGAPIGGLEDFDASDEAEVRVVATDVKLYSKLTGSLWRFVATTWKVYFDGVEVISTSIDETSTGVGPNYVPLVGIPLDLNGSCSAGVANLPVYSTTDLYDYQTEITAVAVGGWRFKQGGAWYSLNVDTPTPDAPSAGSCPFGITLDGIIDAAETWGAEVGSYARARAIKTYEGWVMGQMRVRYICTDEEVSTVLYDETGPAECTGPGGAAFEAYKIDVQGESKSGGVRLLPSLTRSIKRMQPDYGALWLRFPFPNAVATGARSCNDDGDESSASDPQELLPAQSELLSMVGDSAHAIEDTLSETPYAPVNVSASETSSVNYVFSETACTCPPSWAPSTAGFPCSGVLEVECSLVYDAVDPETYSESATFVFPSEVGEYDTYMTHEEALARYMVWANPHWHYAMWFPPNEIDSDADTIPDQQDQWPVDGGAIAREYWAKIREQWLYQSALPSEEKTEQRNFCISNLIDETGHTPFLDAYFGGHRWLGVSRWQTDEIVPDAFKDLGSDSEDAWSAEDCALTFGSDIVVDPSASTCKVRFNPGFFASPYLYPFICDRILVDWESANVAAMRVYVVGVDGRRSLLRVLAADTGTTSGVTYRIPKAGASKYAGSWAIENGAGYVTDLGADSSASGISLATMGDAERALAFQLLAGRGFAYIEFEIDVTDPDSDVTLNYPRFIYGGEHPFLVQENAQVANLLWEDGPGVRWGNWLWFDGSTLSNPPAPVGLGYKSTIIDWLCARRVLIEGIAHDDGLTTELASRYDSYEGQSVSQVDRESLAFVLPRSTTESDHTIRAALCNSFSEVPPLTCFPFQARDTDDWSASAGHALEVWDWCQVTRRIVSDRSNTHLFVGGVQWTSDSSLVGVPTGWFVTEHSHAVDNTETDARVKRGAAEYGKEIRPWHGLFTILALQGGGSISADVGPNYTHYRAHIEDGAVVLSRRGNQHGSMWEDIDTGIQAEYACIRIDQQDKQAELLLITESATGDIELRTSVNGGDSFGAMTTIATGGTMPSASVTVGGLRHIVWIDGTDVKRKTLDRGGNVMIAESVIASGVDEEGLALINSPNAQGKTVLSLHVYIGGELMECVSDDGGFAYV